MNGTIDNCGTKVGSRCTFGCVDGFYLDRGSSSRTCHDNGRWDGKEAHCSGNKVDTCMAMLSSVFLPSKCITLLVHGIHV